MATSSKSNKKEKQLRLKLVKTSLKSLDTWPALISKGKPIIQEILRQESTDFDVNLQNSCENLTGIVDQFQEIVTLIEANHQKLTSLQDLSNLSLDTSVNQSLNLDSSESEIIECHETVLKSLQNQLQILLEVSKNIAFKKSDQAVFLACSWTLQPCLNDDYLTALEYLKSL